MRAASIPIPTEARGAAVVFADAGATGGGRRRVAIVLAVAPLAPDSVCTGTGRPSAAVQALRTVSRSNVAPDRNRRHRGRAAARRLRSPLPCLRAASKGGLRQDVLFPSPSVVDALGGSAFASVFGSAGAGEGADGGVCGAGRGGSVSAVPASTPPCAIWTAP